MNVPPKRDMDEPVNIDLSPEDAFRVLFDTLNDDELGPNGKPFGQAAEDDD